MQVQVVLAAGPYHNDSSNNNNRAADEGAQREQHRCQLCPSREHGRRHRHPGQRVGTGVEKVMVMEAVAWRGEDACERDQ